MALRIFVHGDMCDAGISVSRPAKKQATQFHP